MINRIKTLFKSELGNKVYRSASGALEKEHMTSMLKNGVLVGLSGGPDSVFLLSFLKEYSNNNFPFKIVAVHVNHMIRVDDADRDMNFSRELAGILNVEFISVSVDVPKLAAERGKGIEETARNERYSVFNDIVSSRNDVETIAVAHNSTDNLETVLFNMFRGSGTKGMCGILPVRDNIIRPLVTTPKKHIKMLLDEYDIPYVIDATNECTDYTRNYIRKEIIPKLTKLNPSPEDAVLKLCEIMRTNVQCLDSLAKDFYKENLQEGKLPVNKLCELPTALCTEVIIHLTKEYGVSCEYTHLTKILELLPFGNFQYSLPSNSLFVSEDGQCYVADKDVKLKTSFDFPLALGVNKFEGFDSVIIVSYDDVYKTYSNVYRIAIQQRFKFDIIEGDLRVRSKIDGDFYRYGGMTHKLKKLFNDRNVPVSQRDKVAIICDKKGILWPVGFSPRQEENENTDSKYLYIALAQTQNDSDSKRKFYLGN